MPAVLTMDSTVQCGVKVVTPPLHGGDVTITSSAKLTVNGAKVLTKSGIVGKPVTGCATAVTQTTAPCTAVTSVATLASTKLTVGGVPVMIGLTGQSTVAKGTPGPLFAAADQTKLTAL